MPTSVDAKTAAAEVADVRCQHEAACNKVGGAREYASPVSCVAELARSAETELGPNVCPRGIDMRRLSHCTQQVGVESCDPLAPLGLMIACDPTALCVREQAASLGIDDYYVAP
jgi:hypothetical protein